MRLRSLWSWDCRRRRPSGPNDVVINHRKVCGILTEMKADPEKIDYVVIGIGINVNQTEFAEGISATATSLRLEADMQEIDRADLLVSVLRHFRENFILYEKTSRIRKDLIPRSRRGSTRPAR